MENGKSHVTEVAGKQTGSRYIFWLGRDGEIEA